MQLQYVSYNGQQKTWNPQTDGYYFIQVREKINNADGSYFNQSTLGHFSTLNDLKTAWQAVLCVRPDLKDVIRPIKAPCAFDAPKTYILVERWN